MEYEKDYFGFVYIWYNKKNFELSKKKRGRKGIPHPWLYVGSHMGSIDDGYDCSQPKMKEARRKNSSNFKRRIVYWHKTQDRKSLYVEENKWLSLIEKEELGVKFYNGTKSAFGPECCDLEKLWQDSDFRAKQDASWTPERRESQRQNQLHSWTEERKENWSEFQKKLWKDPNHESKIRSALEPIWSNTEIHEVHSRHMTELWSEGSKYRFEQEIRRKDPEYRARLSKSLTGIPRKRPEKKLCPYCLGMFNPGPFKLHHGEKCKSK